MRRVLIVSKRQFPLAKLKCHFSNLLDEGYDFIDCDSYQQAEGILVDLEHPVVALVVDLQIPGAVDFLQQLKNEEFFVFLAILALIDNDSEALLQELFSCGCRHYLKSQFINKLFVKNLSNILVNAQQVYHLEHRMSLLQEKAIHDFILLDIIKNYIPRTTWMQAENFAEKQRFTIPEAELDLCICFADICSFSSLSQYRSPKEVITMLNLLFEVATRYIYFFGGDVDKFIGDAFLAIFTDVRLAVVAMFGIQQEIKKGNSEKLDQNHAEKPVIEFRIGVHIGSIIRGNVGGHHRYDNTLIGDTVNTASRLEGKSPHGGMVISEKVRRRLELNIPQQYRLASELKGRHGEEIYWNVFDYFEENPFIMPELSYLAQIMAMRDGEIKTTYAELIAATL